MRHEVGSTDVAAHTAQAPPSQSTRPEIHMHAYTHAVSSASTLAHTQTLSISLSLSSLAVFSLLSLPYDGQLQNNASPPAPSHSPPDTCTHPRIN